jgi:basic amino acid/polyamine antiporter, APA family
MQHQGVQVGKGVMNALTAIKLALVALMIGLGLWHFTADNFEPFAPMGASGVLRGSTAAFFGYLGYDEVSHSATHTILYYTALGSK